MKLHLVGGFLGSGKTTAIINAARQLMKGGLKVGVVTNDQGRYLVDTAFVRFQDIPTVEVTGGCFCCNYGDLDDSLAELVEKIHPDVVFAESVGSCADLVATVLKPLISISNPAYSPASLSVFTDARLLRRKLGGQPMPFSEDVVYIFDKQLEEAGLIVINKIDLIPSECIEELQTRAALAYPGVKIRMMSALEDDCISSWLDDLTNGELSPRRSLELDYQRYGAGEAQLAWLDARVLITGRPKEITANFLDLLVTRLREAGAGIGHLKMTLPSASGEVKFSLTGGDLPASSSIILPQDLIAGEMLLNLRAEIAESRLRDILSSVLTECEPYLEIREQAVFHPGQPVPVHRIS